MILKTDTDSLDSIVEKKKKRVKFLKPESELSEPPNFDDNESIASEYLFMKGIDDIVYEGEMMKFKPGLSANFVSRYV